MGICVKCDVEGCGWIEEMQQGTIGLGSAPPGWISASWTYVEKSEHEGDSARVQVGHSTLELKGDFVDAMMHRQAQLRHRTVMICQKHDLPKFVAAKRDPYNDEPLGAV